MKLIKFVLSIAYLGFLCSCNNNQKDTSSSEIDQAISDSAFVNGVAAFKSVDRFDTIPYKKVIAQGSAALPMLVQDVAPVGCGADMPKKIEDLNSGAGFNLYKFTSDNQATAKAFGFDGSIGKNELLVIQDYVRYKNVTCNNQLKKFGIGLRCFIHVKSLKGKLAATLPGIAASVELSRAQGQFNLAALGFAFGGDSISDLPTQGEYNVNNFGNLAIVFNNVLKTLKDGGNVKIDPVELP
jgi:hypothetical protein